MQETRRSEMKTMVVECFCRVDFDDDDDESVSNERRAVVGFGVSSCS